MPTNTYVTLGSYTVTGSNLYGPTGVTFTIPSGYTDIRMVFDGSVTAASITCLQFNGSGGTAYSWTWIGGSGSAASSNRGVNQPLTFLTNVGHMTSSRGTIEVDIMNYSNTNVFKTVLSRANNGGGLGVDATASTWRSTAAITTVQIFLDRAESFVVGSTFTVYGVANSDKFALATGGIIREDSTYWYHVFGANGTFTPKQSLTADILVVAGGGAGGDYFGGGGGAGGAQVFTSQSLSATGYTCTVGAGAAKYSYPSAGTNGGNSQFGSLTASVGGGYGASGGGRDGASGIGSGGSGGGGASGSTTSGAAGTSGQGFAGGNSAGPTGNYGSAGGGGAGAMGGNGGTDGGAGGVGITSSFINAIGAASGIGQYVSGNWYLAGGGGGAVGGTGTQGPGGNGGGGIGCKGNNSGQITILSAPGTQNTGGGGGGGWTGAAGGLFGDNRGGSGVIVIRYAK